MGEPIDRLRESIYCKFSLLNLPEFGGEPGESIEAFLKDFSRATTTFAPERKCLAIKRALTGDAAIFMKNYLKPVLTTGNWKEIKETLRDRFARPLVIVSSCVAQNCVTWPLIRKHLHCWVTRIGTQPFIVNSTQEPRTQSSLVTWDSI